MCIKKLTKVANKMKIGNLELENNVFLAPMAGTTDKVFRILCKEYGCGMVYSEMVSAKGLMYNSKNTEKLLETDDNEHPVAIQIFGSDPKIMAEAAKRISKRSVDIIDINMGCPVPKVVKNGEGSALMLNPKLVGEIVYAVSSAINKPVTIKIRKGFNNANINAPLIAKIAEENGAAAVAVHGRTREQYYAGDADWNIIREVKKAVKIPVIGNGDIINSQRAIDMFNQTECDAIMIGRAAEGNPWIFSQILKHIEKGVVPPSPTFYDIMNLIYKHLDMLCEYKGEYIAVMEMRRHIGKYVKGMPKCSELRVAVNKAQTKNEMLTLLAEYEELYKNIVNKE